MRDLLPDLLHGRLPAAEQARVQAHVAACADCRAELSLLRDVRESAVTPRVDVARIASAIPPYRRVTPWTRAWQSVPLRAAAGIVIVAGAAALALRQDARQSTIQVADSTPAVAAPFELPLGETFYDVSDSDLRALVEELRQIEAVMPEEPADYGLALAPLEGM